MSCGAISVPPLSAERFIQADGPRASGLRTLTDGRGSPAAPLEAGPPPAAPGVLLPRRSLGSMTRAAERLLLSQPAVSLHDTRARGRAGDRAVRAAAALASRSLRPGSGSTELAVPLVEGVDGLEPRVRQGARRSPPWRPPRRVRGCGSELRSAPGVPGASCRDYPDIRAHLRTLPSSETLSTCCSPKMSSSCFGSPGSGSGRSSSTAPSSLTISCSFPPRGHPLAGRGSVTPEEIASLLGGRSGLRCHLQPAKSVNHRFGISVSRPMWSSKSEAGRYRRAVCRGRFRSRVLPLVLHHRRKRRCRSSRSSRYFGKRSYGWFMRCGKPLSWPARRLDRGDGGGVPRRSVGTNPTRAADSIALVSWIRNRIRFLRDAGLD